MSQPDSRPMAPGPLYAPGFRYEPNPMRRYWMALWPRKNKDKAKPQQPKIRKPRKAKGGGKK